MSKFITSLKVEQIDDTSADGGGTWRLLAPLAYKSDLAQQVFVAPTGFETDFASVPRLPVIYALTGNTAHPAAVIHDRLYTTHEVDRATADAVLREASIASGVPAWRAWMMWAGVRVGGASHWATPES